MENNTKNSERKSITAILFAILMISSALVVIPLASAEICSIDTDKLHYRTGETINITCASYSSVLEITDVYGNPIESWNLGRDNSTKSYTIKPTDLTGLWTIYLYDADCFVYNEITVSAPPEAQ